MLEPSYTAAEGITWVIFWQAQTWACSA